MRALTREASCPVIEWEGGAREATAVDLAMHGHVHLFKAISSASAHPVPHQGRQEQLRALKRLPGIVLATS